MSAAQLAMPWGRERRYFGPRKSPGKFYNLIQWFLRTKGRCWATLEYLAARIGVSVRTLQRWWAENAAAWGVERRRTTGNTWEFFISKVSPQTAQTVTPPAAPPLYESKSELVPLSGTSSAGGDSNPPAKKTPSVPVTYPEGLQVILGMCIAHGKMISRPDMQDASAAWIGAQIEIQGITGQVQEVYLKACRNASAPRYVPAPGPWLRAEGWTRCEIEPMCKPESKIGAAMRGAMNILLRREQNERQ